MRALPVAVGVSFFLAVQPASAQMPTLVVVAADATQVTAEAVAAAAAIKQQRDSLTPEEQRRTLQAIDERLSILNDEARVLQTRYHAAQAAEARNVSMRNRESSENIARKAEALEEVRLAYATTRNVAAGADSIPVTQIPAVLEAFAQFYGPLFMVCGPVIWSPADPKDYRALLQPHLDVLLRLGRSVGRIEISETGGPVVGTGFMVGPRHVMTNRHVLEKGQIATRGADGKWQLRNSPATVIRFPGEFDLRSEHGCSQRPAPLVARVMSVEVPDESLDLAVLILVPRGPGDPALPPPLPLQQRTTEYYRNAQGVAVIGYPGRPNDMTVMQFYEYFRSPFGVAGEIDVKRLSPGETKDDATLPEIVFRYNSNTAPGSSGSPVIDIRDRAVIGVHYEGLPRSVNADGVNYGIVSRAAQGVYDEALRRHP